MRDQVGYATLGDTVNVTARALRRMACTASIIPVVMDTEGRVLDIGRQSRKLTVHLRRALHLRDKGCAFPACNRPPKHCDAHHVVEWINGGKTSVDNLTLLCRRHRVSRMRLRGSDVEARITEEQCCAGDGGRPSGIAVQAEVPNHRKLR